MALLAVAMTAAASAAKFHNSMSSGKKGGIGANEPARIDPAARPGLPNPLAL